jgi:uncharacterized protein (TIGR01777 family)
MIGRALHRKIENRGEAVRLLVRRPATTDQEYSWDGQPGSVPAEAITWADAVVSLSGAPIARLPWTKAYRRQIMDSRVDATSAIARAITQSTAPPAVWVTASATGYYGDRSADRDAGGAASAPGDQGLTEQAVPGTGVLAGVTRAWEAAARPAAAVTRLVIARTGIVLGPDGGTLALMARATRLGLGARFGSGRQYWPWISLRDEVRAWDFALRHESISGPVNLVGPTLATAGQIAGAVAQVLHRPCWLTVPAPVLRAALGAAADDLILASQPVRPTVLTANGFKFEDQTVESAVRTALKAER